MKQKILRSVNWEGGMFPKAEHFIQTEDYFNNRLCMSQRMYVNPFNYGLIPPLDHTQTESCDVKLINTVTERIQIELHYCSGITLGGYMIHYKSEPNKCLTYEISVSEIEKGELEGIEKWNIILTVDPFQRIPVGELEREGELPPRYPDVMPAYRLYIVPVKGSFSGLDRNSLIVGRIKKNGTRFDSDNHYIPPCTCALGDRSLKQFYENSRKSMGNIEKASKDIVSKIINRSDSSPMALNIMNLSRNILNYIATINFEYKNMGVYWMPIEIVNNFSALANVCYCVINCLEKTEKEEVLKYFYEWSGVNPASFEGMLSDAIENSYVHEEINSTLFSIDRFLVTFSELWIMLANLEYIGKHKENIVVGERVERITTESKTRWTVR